MAEVMLVIGIVFVSFLLSFVPAFILGMMIAHVIAFFEDGLDYEDDIPLKYLIYPFLWFQSISWLLIGYLLYYFSH